VVTQKKNMALADRAKLYLSVMQSSFRQLRSHFNYRILILSAVIAAILWILMATGVVRPGKEPLETAAVVVTGILMLIAALRFILSRQVFFLWSTALFLLIMCREIHFAGTDEAIFIGLLVLLGIILFEYDRFKAYLANPRVVNLLVAGFFTYFLSQTVDQRWWRIIPGEDLINVSLEETLELLGHVLIGLAVVFCRRHRVAGEINTTPS
jgi:hypothetical protein